MNDRHAPHTQDASPHLSTPQNYVAKKSLNKTTHANIEFFCKACPHLSRGNFRILFSYPFFSGSHQQRKLVFEKNDG